MVRKERNFNYTKS
uniref:Uncharacterized protein n=1 Tax=Arundo donax TaxID=35708 RepID=A0A0A9FQE8_ARUDO